MALWDKLKNLISNDEYVMRELQPVQEQPVIKGLQMKEDGTVYEIPTPTSDKQVTFGQRLGNALLGTPTRTIEAYDDQGKPIYSSGMVREGGAFRDITKGYNENVNQRFSPNNWGQDKNAMTRIGELLGTTARFADSPAGKMLLAYGASNMLGDTNPLEQALTAGVTNINAGNTDKIYRDDLVRTQQNTLRNNPAFNALSDTEKAQILSNLRGENTNYDKLNADKQAALLKKAQNEYLADRQNQQLQDIANNVYNRRGFITEDVYKNLVNTQQLRDNADWKKMYFDTQQRNLEQQRDWQRRQAELQRQEKAADRAFQYYNANLNHQDRLAALEASAAKNDKTTSDIENLNAITEQLKSFQDTFKKVNNPYRYRAFGKEHSILGKKVGAEYWDSLTPEESNFQSKSSLLLNVIARDLGGEKGVLSDQDIARIKESIPRLEDTLEQKDAKMSAIYDLLEIRLRAKGIDWTNPYKLEAQGSVVRKNYENKINRSGSNTQTIGKYKVTVKG